MRSRLIGAAAAVGFFAVALAQARWVNTDPTTHDQSAYLTYALEQASTRYAALGNRMQMPVYPSLHSLFVSPAETPELAFGRAKLVAIGLGALATALVWTILLARLERAQALAIGLVYTLTIAAFRSAYVQCEPVYYALSFAAFVAMADAWEEPALEPGFMAGALAGVAWLTKGSMLLGAEIFLVALALRGVVSRAPRDLVKAALFALAFALVIAPYAENSRACCGGYLYNMSTRYVVWFDSWEQFLAKAGELGPAMRWHELPPDRYPTMGSYLATHPWHVIAARELRGLALVFGNTVQGTGYQLFAYGWLALALHVLARDPALRARVFPRSARSLWVLAVPLFGLQALALGFYGDIAAGARFSLALFLPATFALHRAMARELPRWREVTDRSVSLALWLALALPLVASVVYAGG